MTEQQTSVSIGELVQSPTAKFENIGDRTGGVIVFARQQQQTDFDTGELKFWNDGNKMMQLVVGIRQADGQELNIYARGGRYEISSGEGEALQNAIVAAVLEAGEKEIKPGAYIEVVHTGLGKAAKRGLNQPKLYRAKYTPEKESVAVAGLFSTDDKPPY